MNIMKVSQYARALYNAHGDRAELEAARRQKEKEAAGDHEQARVWLSIRSAIRQFRGANQS